MLVRLTKRETCRLRQALRLAVDHRDSLIDVYRIRFQRKPQAHTLPKVVPSEYQNDVRCWQRDIEAFKRLRKKLQAAEAMGENDGSL